MLCLTLSLHASELDASSALFNIADKFIINVNVTMMPSRMDGANLPDFIFYGNENHWFDDYDWFEEMFILMLQLHNLYIESDRIERVPQRTSALDGYDFIHKVLTGHPSTSYELFRMKREAFTSLCTTLRARYLEDSCEIRMEELLAIFYLIAGHRQRMRVAADWFQHSTETICRHFKRVM